MQYIEHPILGQELVQQKSTGCVLIKTVFLGFQIAKIQGRAQRKRSLAIIGMTGGRGEKTEVI